jgi:hypothetical protein
MLQSSEAFVVGAKGHIGASVEAHTPGGSAAALAGLGTNGFRAPAGANFVDVYVHAASVENCAVVVPPFGWASARATLRLVVDEYSPDLQYVRTFEGLETIVLDSTVNVVGVGDIRLNEMRERSAATKAPVAEGYVYAFRVFAMVSAAVANTAHAASNFYYDFDPLVYAFS